MHSHPFRAWPLTFVLIAVGVLCAGAPGQAAPRLAQARSAAAAVPRTITVPAGADLQLALDRAAPGDILALAPGATYTGPITLPRKAGDAWIVIKTAAPEAEFPAAGRRVNRRSQVRTTRFARSTLAAVATSSDWWPVPLASRRPVQCSSGRD